MFAQRFDPNSVGQELPKPQIPIKKRKLSQTSIDDEATNEKADTESSSSDSESTSDSDSDSESESSSSESGEETSESQEEDVKPADELKNSMEVDDPVEPREADPDYLKKHASVFQKFKSVQSNDVDMDTEKPSDEEVEKQDLAPLPQPELPRDVTLRSTQAHSKTLDWLAKPVYASPEQTSPFSDFSISSNLRSNIEAMGFKEAFSVQVSVYKMLLEDITRNKLSPDFRGDILVNASTGSGKTLAYCVPIIEALHTRIVPRVRAVILVPTRPLIQQVTQTLIELSKGTKLNVVSLSSDMSIKDEGHKISTNVPDVIVSTPGRLVEHILNSSVTFEALRFLVIDEADRLLNQSFQNWSEILIRSIEEHRDSSRNVGNTWELQTQKLVFSATLTTDAGKLSSLKFRKPRLIVVNSKEQLVNEMFSVPTTLTESKILFASSESSYKPLLLTKLMIQSEKLSNVLIFSRSNDSTLRLAKVLEALFKRFYPSAPITVAYMNSTNNLSSVRNRVFKDFGNGEINILVATDLIARGLDISSIKDVINYDLPVSSREYVHRVGRTARANQRGEALSLVFGRGENQWFNSLMVDVGRNQPIDELYPKAIDLYLDDHEKHQFEDILTKLT
ncbi:uncharacterized protein CXQ87_000386 [Candidozyma duobushaemuli]|uniref:ATP-dependent RNA helicase n=2 Tax=Candidozyma TaxID=3303203 RepID=A0ABX8I2P8_9ASCO|nr:uncharacterized protein CXQ87_000386 [[Candida] duobushaemulonis]PVH17499.1 hypothetical protein CXQ87_000386 [[Candida] duobushaemulonis]QWU86135.1 hypothetical protein CA3LBN_000353 [[Candida] haemuloni]